MVSGKNRVCVTYLYPRDVSGQFCDSLAGMMLMDRKWQDIKSTISIMTGPRVAEARSQLVERFLTTCDEDWLLMLDSDMVFDQDLVHRLLRGARSTGADVIGGLCFAGHAERSYPTIYEIYKEKEFTGARPVPDYPKDALIKVGATGGACLMMSREVLMLMTQPWPKGFGTAPSGQRNPYPWFVEGGTNPQGVPFGEDIAFCMRVNAMGRSVYVDTGAHLGHMKSIMLNEGFYEANHQQDERNKRKKENEELIAKGILVRA